MNRQIASQTPQQKSTATPSVGGVLQRKYDFGPHASVDGGGEAYSKRLGLQTKLTINEPGDIYEQEADRIAAQVMAMPVNSKVDDLPRGIQHLSGGPVGQRDTVPATVEQALSNPGRPLEPSLRQDVEHRFGYDFSQVRVHLGAAAEHSARDVNAHAYTVGHNIVFGAGRFAPATKEGRRLIAHELTHVVQQENANIFQHSDSNMIQLQSFRDCTPVTTGTAMTQDEIDNLLLGSRMVAEISAIFAGNGVRKIRDGTASAAERTVFRNHFGNPTPGQTNTILNRFSVITRRLSSNDLFICNTATNAYCSTLCPGGCCAYNDCPSARGLTHICPPFFGAGCGQPENTMIHESAHAAGACDDNYPGAGYPPANAHNNAPSYAEFASAIF